ncbi:cytochrome P450 3A9-like isoform X2, partial [Leptotrombidium deliense]
MSYLINERRTKKVAKNDILQLLLDAETEELKKNDDPSDKKHFSEESIRSLDNNNIFKNFKIRNKKLTSDEILAQIVLLMLAGYHTTAVLLGYCTYALAIFPGVQEKLHAELKRLFSKEEDINYENLNACVYLDAFISETLRYYPPVVAYDLVASKDYNLPDGLLIEKGVRINFPAYAVHHDPEYYENP